MGICKGPFIRSDFKDMILGSKNWTDVFRESNFNVPFLSAPFIFHEECRMKMEHVLSPSGFFNITDPCIVGSLLRLLLT